MKRKPKPPDKNTVACLNPELADTLARLKAEGKRVFGMARIENGYRLSFYIPEPQSEQAELL